MKIKAAVVNSLKEDYQIENLLLAEPQDDELLIRVVASGICKSDETIRMYPTPVKPPVVLGHEGSGIVEKVGPAVKGFEVGDHVVISYAYCGQCPSCLIGKPASCTTWQQLNFFGTRDDGSYTFHKEDGTPVSNFYGSSTFATYTLVHRSNLTKVPKDIDLRMVGPLGCGFLTGAGTVINGLKPTLGSSIAIFGTGAVGTAAMMAAKLEGCSTIIAVDIHDHRLEIAKSCGATHTINSKKENVLKRIKEISEGEGVNYCVDTSGIPTVIKTAIASLAIRGVIAPIAVSHQNIEINISGELMVSNKQLIGVLMGDAVPQLTIPQLVKFQKAGQFPIDQLIKFYQFEEINEATQASNTGEVIKPILIIDEDYRF